MIRTRRLAGIVFGLGGAFALAGSLGSGCDFTLPEPTTIQVELWNDTEYPVDPFLYVEESIVNLASQVIKDENFYDIGDSILPGETVTLTIPCEDAGTMLTDRAELLLSADSAIQSATSPMIRQNTHFECGDTVTFVFFVNASDVFRTAVAVNDVYVFE